MIIGQAALVFCDPVRQVGRPEHDSVRLQVCVVPGQGVVVERVAAEEVLGCIRVKQVIHQENLIHILLVENREVMDGFFIREEISQRIKSVRFSADFRDNEKL